MAPGLDVEEFTSKLEKLDAAMKKFNAVNPNEALIKLIEGIEVFSPRRLSWKVVEKTCSVEDTLSRTKLEIEELKKKSTIQQDVVFIAAAVAVIGAFHVFATRIK